MKKTLFASAFTACLLLCSCQPASQKEATNQTTLVASATEPGTAQIRADIQDLENRWAAAINAGDINTLMEMYTEDAVSMPAGDPMLQGKDAIRKYMEAMYTKGNTNHKVEFQTMDVYGQGNLVTEVGKAMYKDSTGHVVRTGKYMSVFENQNGTYRCLREIYNDDSK